MIFLISIVLFVLFLYLENTAVGVTELSFSSEKIPAAFDGYRILQVSDLHNARLPRLLPLAKKTAPDYIILTGDMLDRTTVDYSIAEQTCRELAALAPTAFIPGNHETANGHYKAFRAALADMGITILENRGITLSREGQSIALAGVKDYLAFTGGAAFEAQLARLRADAQDAFFILLSHRAEKMEAYKACGADLVFAGHAHGGQIRLPFAGGLVGADGSLFPYYTSGIYKEDGTAMVVSRGLGNSSRFPQRIFNRPELVVVTLRAQ